MKKENITKGSRHQNYFISPITRKNSSNKKRLKRTQLILRSWYLNSKEKIESYQNLPYREKQAVEGKVLFFIFFIPLFILIQKILFAIISNLKLVFNTIPQIIVGWNSRVDLDTVDLFGKTVWNWAELLIVPILLGFSGVLYKQFLVNQEVDRNKNEALKSYFNQMAILMLNPAWPITSKEDLIKSNNSKEVTRIASIVKALTSMTLRELDLNRKNTLLRFLTDSGSLQFISMPDLDLSYMNLSRVNLFGALLEEAVFEGTSLIQANMRQISAQGASFIDAILDKADLTGANLEHAHFYSSELVGTNLTEVNLVGAELNHAILVEADFTGADLTGASFKHVDLENANFHRAILKDIYWDEYSFMTGNILGLETAINLPEALKQHLEVIHICEQPDQD